MIARQLYEQIVQVLPIVCVDVIIRAPDGRYLLVKRRNEPLQGEWWVVGGRILHGEPVLEAVRRKMREEIGIDPGVLTPVGFYEDRFDRNAFGVPGIYHTLSLVFETLLKGDEEVVLDEQSSEWAYAETLPSRFVVTPWSTPF